MWYYCTRYFTNVQPVCAALGVEKRERFSRIPSDFAPPPRRSVHRAPCRRVHRAPRGNGSCGKMPVGCICFADGSAAPTPDPMPWIRFRQELQERAIPGSSVCRPIPGGVCEEERHTHPHPNPIYAGSGRELCGNTVADSGFYLCAGAGKWYDIEREKSGFFPVGAPEKRKTKKYLGFMKNNY